MNDKYKNILVTGGAGFIGSNFIPYFINLHKDYNIINLDLLTYAGNIENLSEIRDKPNYKFIKGDICNRDLVEYIFNEFDINAVIHFAAESHVDNSIVEPDKFIKTNIFGTFTLLDIAYKYWMKKPFEYKNKYLKSVFHHISTDEVYGSLGENGYFTENTPYSPRSPYSASKASSDLLAKAYFHTYGLNIVVTNCSNNYGPKQHDEKFIPTIIRNAIFCSNIPIYGDGKNIRDWIYVLDHCKGIDLVFHSGKIGETYNIGGNNEKTNIYIANKICEILEELLPINNNRFNKEKKIKNYKELINFVEDRPGHDKRYAIDATKISNNLGWKAQENFESGIVKTIKWYIRKYYEKQ